VPYSSEQQLFPGRLARGLPLYAHVPVKDGYWADVGRFDTYLQANGDVLEGSISWFEPTVNTEATDACVANSVDIQSNVTLGHGASIGPRVSIGARASIGDEALIEDSITWAGSVIGAKARLNRCIIAGGTVPEGACLTDEVIV
jgi:mannose-1-phosphate guanylyltransferase/phosphomannomutase